MRADHDCDKSRVVPSDVVSTTKITNAVRIQSKGWNEFEPISIPDMFERTIQKHGDKLAMVARPDHNGISLHITYKEYNIRVMHTAKVFIKLGLQTKHTVAVLSANCPEWLYSEMGVIHAGGVFTGIYTTSSPEAVFHILQNSKANIVVVDDAKQMEKIRQIRNKLPLLKAAVQVEGPFEEFVEQEDGFYKWSDLEDMSVVEVEEEFRKRLRSIAINECCALIYTSGTVGLPKAVMVSHDNFIFAAKADLKCFSNIVEGEEKMVSYLPLSHAAGQFADVFICLLTGATLYFAGKDALKGSLTETLLKVHPTFFGGVPRVFQKLQDKMIRAEIDSNPFQKYVLNWCRNVILQYYCKSCKGSKFENLKYQIATFVIGYQVQRILGLDAARTVFIAAATSSAELKKFFISSGINVVDAYGLSETSGGHCIPPPVFPYFGSVGPSVPYTETKIINADQNGCGEICVKGRHVFMGYLGDELKTKEAIDEDGWFRTGDAGFLDEKKNLYITGRLKELIITAGGENIPPVHIENLVKQELPKLLSSAFLIGDNRKYLTMLLTLKTKTEAESGAALDCLDDDCVEFLQENLGLSYTTVKEVLDAGPCPKVLNFIQQGIDRVNANAISRAQRVQKFAILPQDFSIPTGELGPTLKLKRNAVSDKYQNVINGMYD